MMSCARHSTTGDVCTMTSSTRQSTPKGWSWWPQTFLKFLFVFSKMWASRIFWAINILLDTKIMGSLLRIVGEFQFWLKLDSNYGYFTCAVAFHDPCW